MGLFYALLEGCKHLAGQTSWAIFILAWIVLVPTVFALALYLGACVSNFRGRLEEHQEKVDAIYCWIDGHQ